MVNPALLQRAVEITGAKDQSEAIELALRRLEEDAFILEGLASLRGAFPDHPDHDP
jgi:Arc/MetJ family transcription regulator